MINNGIIDALSGLIPTLSLPLILVLMIVCLLVFAGLIVLPVATSLVAILGTPFMIFGIAAGASPDLVIMAVALCACNCYLLPLDTVTLITYSKGYFTMTDMMKSTVILQVVLVIIVSLWLPVVGMITNII